MEAKAKAYANTSIFLTLQALEKMFERDWQRVCSKEKFTSMMNREHKVWMLSAISTYWLNVAQISIQKYVQA